MKKLALLAVVSLLALTGFNQAPGALVGKWKIVIVDAGVYHDYKKDSTSIPEEMKAALKGNKDSAMTIGFMTGLIKGFSDYYFDFKADGTYDEIKGEKIKQKGTYVIDPAQKLLVQTTKNSLGDERKNQMHYTLTGKTMTVIPVDDTRKLMFVLEKQE
jgi:hypothetical protein